MVFLLWGIWILLSGKVTWFTVISGAVVSAGLYFFCRKVLGYRGEFNRRAVRQIGKLLGYLGGLVVEMMRAGFVVMRLIYGRGREIEPVLVWFDCPLQSDGARSMLANSITLTAGTITVSSEKGRFCVHALDRSLAKGIEKSEFARKLEALDQ